MARVIDNLHVRVSALFLGLLVVAGAVYYGWMNHMVFAPPAQDEVEEYWYAELADAEVDSLARVASAAPDRLSDMALEYGTGIADFGAEVVFFNAQGQVLTSSDPDSLDAAVVEVDPELLRDMLADDWAFDEIYPDPSNIDAYVNRIFNVAPVNLASGETGFLAITWKPLIFTEADVQLDARKLWLQAVLVALVAAFVVGWVVMAWLTRRIRVLNRAVGDLAAGHLSRRIDDDSSDDLGRLGRDFNAMAERLEDLVADLRGKEEFQRQLVANVSHDLRTPLASVRGYLETISMRGGRLDDEENARYIEIMNNNLTHLDRLVDHLLQLSRLESGQARFALEEFPLPELLEGVLARAEGPAGEKGMTITCEPPADLSMVLADPMQIVQVLQNLVGNAVKFGLEGGHISISMNNTGDNGVEVLVADDGPGIAPDVLPHIFERFYTGDMARTAKGQSSGLGLAISQRIIEGHGSRITVESELGKGSTFAFTLRAASGHLRASE